MIRRFRLSVFARNAAAGVLMLTSLLFTTACSQRELCYDHSHVSPVALEFDWSEAPDAAPETMVVWFFSVNSDESYRFELTQGGTAPARGFDSRIKVRPGTYRVLCHNGSTYNNSEQGRLFEDYRLTTSADEILSPMNRYDKAPLPDAAGDQPVRTQASTVYAHTLGEPVTVEPAAQEEKHIRFTPAEVTSVYDIVITGVQNLRADTEASAVITGMAEAWSPAGGRPAGTEVTVPFGLNHCGSDCLRGSVVVFGDNKPHDVRHWLRVYTSYKYYYDYDVTEQIHDAVDSRHIDINIDGLRLPASGEGMSPGINDWDKAEEVEIIM